MPSGFHAAEYSKTIAVRRLTEVGYAGATRRRADIVDTGVDRSADYFSNKAITANAREGHTGEVFAARFNSTATHIATGSMDRSISAPT